MIRFLHWAGSIVAGTLNGFVKLILAVVVILLAVVVIGLAQGDGLPGNMVLSLDLRSPIADSASSEFSLSGHPVTVMDIVLGLDSAGRDKRVKGVYMRLGSANLSIAEAEEIGAALKRFRATGKFVIAHAQGFVESGLGDYLAASAADQIWMQPNSPFFAAGVGGSRLFLRGLLDKVEAVPQIAKRAEYKSAADMYMEHGMSAADREQMSALMQSWYVGALEDAASARKLDPKALAAAFDASPQFTEDAVKAKLVDKTGYDDDALAAALTRAGSGAKAVPAVQYVRVKQELAKLGHGGKRIALIEASGDIVEGGSGGGLFGSNTSVIAGDDMAGAIRDATNDKDIGAILIRLDSPGGSVTASDQILDAVRKAQTAGKPVIVSMGAVAASGGYYISLSADEIVAEPATITGSIGVYTGKVTYGKSLEKIGVTSEQFGVGKNVLMNSSLTPYTDEEWAAVNKEADAIYVDFTGKVATGRKLPIEKVREIARGRVWTGADAKARGLVDTLGGFWTAVDAAKKRIGAKPGERVTFVEYPRHKGFFAEMNEWLGGSFEMVRALENFNTLMNAPGVREAVTAVKDAPRSAIELRATNLPTAQ